MGLWHGADLLWEEFTRDSPLGLPIVSVKVVQAPESQGATRQTPTSLGRTHPGWMLLIPPAGLDARWPRRVKGRGQYPEAAPLMTSSMSLTLGQVLSPGHGAAGALEKGTPGRNGLS